MKETELTKGGERHKLHDGTYERLSKLSDIGIEKPKPNVFCEYIWRRIKQNKNFLCCITGSTGSGKSFSSLRIGEMLDPSFNITRVCFTSQEFMELLNYGNLKKGNVIIFDEAGISMSSRTWQSLHNRMINFVLQTFRHKNIIVFFTVPTFSFIDSMARNLFHANFETCSINQSEKTVSMKPFFLQINQGTGKIYRKYLRVIEDGQAVPYHRWHVGLPTKELIGKYEKKKSIFTDDLNREILKDLQKDKEKKEDKTKELTPTQRECINLLKSGLNKEEASKKLGITIRAFDKNIVLARKKGYSIVPIKDDDKVRVIGYKVVDP